MPRRIAALRFVAALMLAGCASGGTMATAGQPHRDPNVITSDELAKENSPSVYDAIQHLRPELLQPRPGSQSSSIDSPQDYTVHVYLDNSRLGELSDLRSVPVSTIREIRYLNPAQAMQRFGSGNPGGVLLLISR